MQHHSAAISADLIHALVQHALGKTPEAVRLRQVNLQRSIFDVALTGGARVLVETESPEPREGWRLALEAWAIQQASRAGLPVPELLALDWSCATFPVRYLVLARATGVPFLDAQLPDTTRINVLYGAGRLLARLHQVPVRGYGLLNDAHFQETGEVMARFARWAVPSTLRAEAALNELYGAGVIDVEEAAAAMHLVEAEAALDEPPSRLLHDGFIARDLLVEPDSGAITALTGFENRMGGPTSWELAGAWLWHDNLPGLPEQASAYLLEGYETEAGTEVHRGRLRANCLIRLIILMRSLHDEGRDSELPPLRLRLDRLLEDAGRL